MSQIRRVALAFVNFFTGTLPESGSKYPGLWSWASPRPGISLEKKAEAVFASTRPLIRLNLSDMVLSVAVEELFISRPEIEGRELISGRTQRSWSRQTSPEHTEIEGGLGLRAAWAGAHKRAMPAKSVNRCMK